MEQDTRSIFLHKIFNLAIIIKGIDGLLEAMGGFLLLFISHKALNQLVIFLAHGELIEDPRDLVAHYLINFFQNFSVSSQIFLALYLVVHGIVKMLLVISLLKNKGAYPTAIIFFLVFIFYEIYRYYLHHSVILLSLTLFDIVVVILILLEYGRIKKFEQ